MKYRILYILLAVQIVGLSAIYAYYQSGLLFPSITLDAHRVDPRDLLRGDYVILNYDISQAPEEMREGLTNRRVYVKLERQGDSWQIADITNAKPEQKPTAEEPWLTAIHRDGKLTYDLEKYFVAEGRGNPTGKFEVVIAIRPDGQPQIKQFLVDGKEWN